MGNSSGIQAKVHSITPSRGQIEKEKKNDLGSNGRQWESLRRWTLLWSDHKESETLPPKEVFQYLDHPWEEIEDLGLFRYASEFGILEHSPSYLLKG